MNKILVISAILGACVNTAFGHDERDSSPLAKAIGADKGARLSQGHELEPIAALDIALLATLAGEASIELELPEKPRDVSKLLLFALRLEATGRSYLASDSTKKLRVSIGDWLALRPPWLSR